MDFKEFTQYRIGRLMRGSFHNTHCCHRNIVDEERFQYIELIKHDGSRHFIYEDEEFFQSYEANFHSKRFTAFHELFTTEEVATDNRSGFPLKYYVRRPASDYTVARIEEVLAQLADLENCTQLEDRISHWGQYDVEVNYHM